ncbi:Uma2 family endonuclease [Candidatus Parabeggiatoa sp. HSG14]|uniref:Uma2 family endonuclease n=1 Tax=Candidatus Parabeggiatoa sp. HSG14 TaxID=3055593 RepID=UPI0025A7F22F|nr:Uma2 family endonuclease [Thiotrichales bacterium HSG14]
MVTTLAKSYEPVPQKEWIHKHDISLSVLQKEWTYEDYLNLPDDDCRYEIIEGVLYVSNAPNIDHQFTVGEIHFQFKLFLRGNPEGYVLTAPFEVHLSQKTRPVQPDVLFIKADKWPNPGTQYFNGAPDLIVEVLSPSTRRLDQSVKFRAYEQANVLEYWMVDPKTHLVQVFSLNNQEYVLIGEFMNDEVIESKVLPDLKIVTASIFNKKP